MGSVFNYRKNGSPVTVIRGELVFEGVTDSAILPTRGHETDAGFDLYCQDDHMIEPGEFRAVGTGVKVELPEDKWALLTGRSSALMNYGLMVYPGVIDHGYTGELRMQIVSLSKTAVNLAKGQRLGQLILMDNKNLVFEPVWGHVEPRGSRGSGGFGSTGQ